jgi:hypothetical protein
MLFVFFFVLGLIAGAIHLLRDRHPRTAGRVAEILLLWLLVVTVGVGGLFVFLAHTVYAEPTAVSIGFPPATPSRPRSPSPTSPSPCSASSATGSGTSSGWPR